MQGTTQNLTLDSCSNLFNGLSFKFMASMNLFIWIQAVSLECIVSSFQKVFLVLVILRYKRILLCSLQVIIVTEWTKEETLLTEFWSMCTLLFEKKGIDIQLCAIKQSFITLICAVFMKDVREVKHIILAERRQLHQRGIVRIELQYCAANGSTLVSFI